MHGSPDIRYLSHSEIDKTKWDHCISHSTNGLIYGYSFYLDCMADHWDGVVLNDYEAVMPLPWKIKYKIAYLYQPFLSAQLGLFFQRQEELAPTETIDPKILAAFFTAIPAKFKFWDIYLNHQNIADVKCFSLYLRTNFVLDLRKTYEEIQKKYRENIRRNIRKALEHGCYATKDLSVDRVMDLAEQQMKSFSGKKFERSGLKNLYNLLRDQQKAISYGVFSPSKELLASSVFFFSHNRAYYILVGNHPDGRTVGASHALIDSFIRDHAGQDLLLDFEGSDMRNLAFFYSGFGAREEKYSAIRLNRLPWYLKWIKGK